MLKTMKYQTIAAACVAAFVCSSICTAGLSEWSPRVTLFLNTPDGNLADRDNTGLADTFEWRDDDGNFATAAYAIDEINADPASAVLSIESFGSHDIGDSNQSGFAVLNGISFTVDSLTRISVQFDPDGDAMMSKSAGAGTVGYFRFTSNPAPGEPFGPEFSASLDTPAMDASVEDFPLRYSGFNDAFDDTTQTGTADLPAGDYEFVFETGIFDFDAGNTSGSLTGFDWLVSFEELEAPDDPGDLPGMDDDGDNGGVGGGPGDGGDPAVIPLPATAWGGLAVGAMVVWRRLRK